MGGQIYTWNSNGCEKQGARSCGAKVNNEEDMEVNRLAGSK